MRQYSKIQTVFKRDDRNVIIPFDYTYPEFEHNADTMVFEATEKVDGTNCRIIIDWQEKDKWTIKYGGKTDNAQLRPDLIAKMEEHFANMKVNEVFTWKEGNTDPVEIILFGEGYGRNIQSGGRYIREGVDFILFDVCINGLYLSRANVVDIASKIGNLKVVPVIGYFTINEAITYVYNGFTSIVAEDSTLPAEGLVLKNPDGLMMRNGERLMLKVKNRDFREYENKYPDKVDTLKNIIFTRVSSPCDPKSWFNKTNI